MGHHARLRRCHFRVSVTRILFPFKEALHSRVVLIFFVCVRYARIFFVLFYFLGVILFLNLVISFILNAYMKEFERQEGKVVRAKAQVQEADRRRTMTLSRSTTLSEFAQGIGPSTRNHATHAPLRSRSTIEPSTSQLEAASSRRAYFLYSQLPSARSLRYPRASQERPLN